MSGNDLTTPGYLDKLLIEAKQASALLDENIEAGAVSIGDVVSEAAYFVCEIEPLINRIRDLEDENLALREAVKGLLSVLPQPTPETIRTLETVNIRYSSEAACQESRTLDWRVWENAIVRLQALATDPARAGQDRGRGGEGRGE